MKKIKMVLPIIAIAIGVSMSAFNTTRFYSSQWHFTGTATSQVNDAANYDQNLSGTDCSSGSLPCIITVPHISGNTDMEDLAAYLSSTSEADVVANADQRKS